MPGPTQLQNSQPQTNAAPHLIGCIAVFCCRVYAGAAATASREPIVPPAMTTRTTRDAKRCGRSAAVQEGTAFMLA
eukprot:364340-Chlamydomonas_euryale.AAC.1